MAKPYKKLDEAAICLQTREFHKLNNLWREQADKATSWQELPDAYKDMVFSELGDFDAFCSVREAVHVQMYEGSDAKKLAREALKKIGSK